MPPRRHAGHLIVGQPATAENERAYSVRGERFLDVLGGLQGSELQNPVSRHQGGAGFIALAEARLTGRAGIVMVTRGPSAANAASAVRIAYQDQTLLVPPPE